MFGLLDDDLDDMADEQAIALAMRSLLNNRRQARAIALRDYSEQLEQDAFLQEYPEAVGLFEHVAAIETAAYRRALQF